MTPDRADVERAMRRAAELASRPVPRHRQRDLDRITGAAEILARQLQQRATSSRRRRSR